MISRYAKYNNGSKGKRILAGIADTIFVVGFFPIVSIYYSFKKFITSFFGLITGYKPFKGMFRMAGIVAAGYYGSILGGILGTLLMPGAGTVAGAFFGVAVTFICAALGAFIMKQISRGLTYLYSTIAFPNVRDKEQVISKTNPWKYRLKYDPSGPEVALSEDVAQNSYHDIAHFLRSLRMAKNNLLCITHDSKGSEIYKVLNGYIKAVTDGRITIERQTKGVSATEHTKDNYTVMAREKKNASIVQSGEVNNTTLLGKDQIKLLGEIFTNKKVTATQENELGKFKPIPEDAVARPAASRKCS